MSSSPCLIVGASQAGAQISLALRRGGWGGRIVLLSDEALLPYRRPPLSKDLRGGAREIPIKQLLETPS